jgi:uncharacterized membrane protein YccF (DUF307 family)
MNTLGNILWIILGGFVVFLLYLAGSVVLFISIVGIPFGVETLKMSVLALLPFGKEVRAGQRSAGLLYIIMNILWILVAGIEIAVVHLMLTLLFGITIVGIPFAVQHLKLARLSLTPFGHDIVEKETGR